MSGQQRLIHRGISDFALFVLVKTRDAVTLAGKRVVVLEANPCMVHGDGCYNVRVSEAESNAVFWMDVTTNEFEERRKRMSDIKKTRRAERRNAW